MSDGAFVHWRFAPSVPRITDYLRGGCDNYASDQALAGRLLAGTPWLRDMVRTNDAYGPRAVTVLAREVGIRQFLDLGCGMPSPLGATNRRHTPLHTFEAASAVHARARVVYVDNDPQVVGHAQGRFDAGAGTRVLAGDLRNVDAIFRAPEVGEFLDLTQPIAVLLHDVLPWISFTDAVRAVTRLRDLLPAGSALSITHATPDFDFDGTAALVKTYRTEAGIDFKPRPLHGLRALLGDWRLEFPGVVPTARWQPSDGTPPPHDDASHAYAAIVTRP